jgi:transcriptional regulator with XRE-family HTH domain
MDSPTEIPVQPTATNSTFARSVGVHFTTASRYRNGERVPSTGVALKIANVYGLDAREILEAIARGRQSFGHFMRMRVFGPEPEVDLNTDGTEKMAA